MIKIPRWCALVAGGVLILLALILAAQIDLTAHHAQMHQNQPARVAERIGQLGSGCQTCHAADQASAAASVPPTTPIEYALSRPAISPQRATLDRQLKTMGERILALPERAEPGMKPVVDAWVASFEQTRQTSDLSVIQAAAAQLATAEEWLQLLENQALPFTLASADAQVPDQAVSAIFHAPDTTFTPITPAAARLDLPPDRVVRSVDSFESRVIADNLLRTALRRGPPAAASMDSFLGRDDHQVNASSLFYC